MLKDSNKQAQTQVCKAMKSLLTHKKCGTVSVPRSANEGAAQLSACILAVSFK